MKKLSLALLTIFSLNNIGGALVFADSSGGSNTSEEEACFKQLTKSSSKINVNLSSVKKTQRGFTSSPNFDVSTHKKFLKIANTPSPRQPTKMKYFPKKNEISLCT